MNTFTRNGLAASQDEEGCTAINASMHSQTHFEEGPLVMISGWSGTIGDRILLPHLLSSTHCCCSTSFMERTNDDLGLLS